MKNKGSELSEEEDIKGVHSAYNTDDITAKPVDPDAPEYQKQPVYDMDKPIKDADGNPVLDADGNPTYEQKVDEQGNPVFTKLEVMRPAGYNFVKDAETGKYTYEDRVDKDQNPLPKFFQVTDGNGKYMIFIKDGDQKRWVPCDADANYYLSYFQEYNFTMAQHYDCEDGFTFTWDDIIDLTAIADNEAEITTTTIVEPENVGSNPKITETEGIYSHVTEDGKTIFTGKPMEEAFVYFLTHDGIRTQMYLSGGLTFTRVTLTQSQIMAFDTVYPMITWNGDDIKWRQLFEKDFDPNKDTFEFIADDRNYVKAVRHEVTPEIREVYYTIDIVSNNTDYEKGFKITYPDTTTAVPMVTDNGEGGDLRFASIDDTMVYPIGKPVEIIETKANGIAESNPLPLGEYWVREIKSADDHISKGEWQKMVLTYEDQYTPVIWDSAEFKNEAVSVKIDLEKLFETAYESKEYVYGSGAVFGIYTGEEIEGRDGSDIKVDKKKIPADTLVGKMVVESGKASATVKLPMGRYYVKEISAPEGFKTNNTKYYFDAVDLLKADQLSFHYKDEGVRGYVSQDGENGVVIDFDTLYRFDENKAHKVNIDGKDYAMDTTFADENSNVAVTVYNGRTNVQIKIKSGQSTTFKFENGAVWTVKADGQTYTAEVSGTAPTKLECGAEGNENFTKTTEGGKTVIKYSPKVTKTNWLSEVEYKYVKPNLNMGEGGMMEIQPANKNLVLTSPEGSSAVTASVDYEFGAADLSFTTGTVNSITVDDKAVNPAAPVKLQRIVRTPIYDKEKPVMDENGSPVLDADGNQTYEQKKDANSVPMFKEDLAATKAVINFADGVTFTVEFDAAGNFYMSAAGVKDGNMDTESTLTFDGKTDLPKGVNLKNTTAKTYARNNTYAGVLNITMHSIKNDRVPPEKPPTDPTDPTDPVEPTPSTPWIKTLAKDSETHTNISLADNSVTIVDTVSYGNLTPGQKYIVKGTLMNQATGKPMSVNGKPVTAEATFTPDKSSGTVDVTFKINASLLKGHTVVVFEELYAIVIKDEGGKDVEVEKPVTDHKDLGDEGQTVHFPEIGTTALDSETDDHISYADKKVTIVDEVTYKNLIPGKKYTVSGILMDKATGKALLVDGKSVTAEKTFTAKESSGSVTLEFTLDASALAGKTTVAFESLTFEGKEIAIHKDITDEGQTVHFPEVKTTASFSDKNEITDIAEYKNLIPGKTYTFKGVLMDKATGEPILIDGKEITAEKTFTAKHADGKVEITFEFDETKLYGKTVVVFEKLFNAKGQIVGSHEDLTDDNQTVKVVKPDEPGHPDNPDIPETGDTTKLLPYIILAIVALVGLVLTAVKRKSKK